MLRFTCCIILAVLTRLLTTTPWAQNLLLTFLLYIFSGGWKWLRILSKTFLRDIKFLLVGITIGIKTKKLTSKNILLSDMLIQNASRQPEKLAYISADTGDTLTFRQTLVLVQKIANVFYGAGYRKGDAVVVLMENRIEYTSVWLGLSAIGVVSCLVNHNLRGESLEHCIAISKCKGIIFSADMTESLREIKDDLDAELYCFDDFDCGDLNPLKLSSLLGSADAVLPPRSSQLSITEDILFYMYTSGTTGLPKAVIIRGGKVLFLLMFGRIGMGFRSDDIIYNPLPLYHGNGAIVATHPIVDGNTCVIKKKFSAVDYMDDCCKHNVTVINYIGESCRYILAQPKRESDHQNKIRLAAGNGLRASIWAEFRDRFRIQDIVELYGCSEGNVGVINNTGKVGAVGFAFVLLPFLNRVKIIKVADRTSGAVLRGSDGLAIEAKPGEFGQIVGTVQNKKHEGYIDDEQTKKKLAYDIFRKGDCVFLSGDVFVQDEEGYFYFMDRTDDTFSWRGEIVSSNAVEGVISKGVALVDVAVYGVDVPNEDGQAGMACFCDPTRKINVDEVLAVLERDLPHYARPVFLRMTSVLETTGTFKLQKKKLREAGYDVGSCGGDDLYYFDVGVGKYEVLSEGILKKIRNGDIHF